MDLHEYLKMPLPKQISSVPQSLNLEESCQPELFSALGKVYSDQYIYSPQDSRLWLELFVVASGVSHDMAVRLQYVRNVGALLILDALWGFKIQPVIDYTGAKGWISFQQYEQLGKNELLPYRQQISLALKELRRRFDRNMIL